MVPTHLLVIRLSAMGDVAMTVPVLRVVAATYPIVKLTVLSRKKFKPFFDDIPNLVFFDAEVEEKYKGITGLLKLANAVKATQIDAVADLHNVLRSKTITATLSLQGIKTATINKGRSAKRALTRANNKKFEPLESTHQRYADVFEKLGFPVNLDDHLFPKRRNWNPTLRDTIGQHPGKLIGIAPFAAFDSKVYPLPLMEKVISHFNASGSYRIVLFGGGAKEENLLGVWASKWENVVSVAGRLTFQNELALLSNIDVMLAMDSGNGHLAAMMGAKVVTLWGVTHPYAGFVPFGQPMANQLTANRDLYPLVPTSVYGKTFPAGYQHAIESIPVEKVIARISEILAN